MGPHTPHHNNITDSSQQIFRLLSILEVIVISTIHISKHSRNLCDSIKLINNSFV